MLLRIIIGWGSAVPSSVKLEVMFEVVVEVEIVIKVGVQLLFWTGGGGGVGGCWLDKTKLILLSTQVEDVQGVME